MTRGPEIPRSSGDRSNHSPRGFYSKNGEKSKIAPHYFWEFGPKPQHKELWPDGPDHISGAATSDVKPSSFKPRPSNQRKPLLPKVHTAFLPLITLQSHVRKNQGRVMCLCLGEVNLGPKDPSYPGGFKLEGEPGTCVLLRSLFSLQQR